MEKGINDVQIYITGGDRSSRDLGYDRGKVLAKTNVLVFSFCCSQIQDDITAPGDKVCIIISVGIRPLLI